VTLERYDGTVFELICETLIEVRNPRGNTTNIDAMNVIKCNFPNTLIARSTIDINGKKKLILTNFLATDLLVTSYLSKVEEETKIGELE
jgi:hypothetical protein